MVTTEGAAHSELDAGPEREARSPTTAARPLRADALSRLGCYVSAAFSVVFIARTSIVVDGRRYFTLFDDAMVSLTYARNLAHGDGLVWVAGDPPVEGITNPLWTGYMAIWHAIGLPETVVTLPIALTGAALVVATALVARALAIRLRPRSPWVPGAVVWTVGLCYPLLYWSLRGMEVGLLAFLTVCALLFALRLRDEPSTRAGVALGLIAAVGVLTRLDFVIVVAVTATWLATQVPRARRLRTLAFALVLPGVALVLETLARLAYYDRIVPNTYDLKLAGIPLATRLERGASVLLGTVVVALVVALMLGALAWWRRRSERSALTLFGAIFAAQAAYSVWVGGDAWEWMRYANRYLAPALAPLLVMAVLGAESLASEGSRARAARSLAAGCAVSAVTILWIERWSYWPDDPMGTAWPMVVPVLLAGLVFLGLAWIADRRWIGGVAVVVLVAVVSAPAMARWWTNNGAYVGGAAFLTSFGRVLEASTEPDARIAVAAAGALGYHSHRPLVDILGKSDPRIAALPPDLDDGFLPGHDKHDLSISVLEYRPDVAAQTYRPTPAEIEAIEQAGYVKVGLGDELSARFPEFVESGRTFYARCDSDAVRWDLLVFVDRGCGLR